jgi:serine/threonine protein kinase/tetratricopeptide (TPR) repeat protein
MSQRDQREEIVFEAALRLAASQRAAYLDQTCAGDPELRRRVEALLGAFDDSGAFLNVPPLPAAARTMVVTLQPSEKPGQRIGRYKLLEQIGEGGCGVVYVAEQEEPVRRRVALKVIKLGMDTKSVLARFDAERQALAMMDHPNIAKVLDAGATETGRPYFVMELVRGIRITDYCDQNRLRPRERLELFAQVCRAIQHAHQKGIIHRDIKPSNILVTLHDGVPVPMVIDFGIAKATQGRLSNQTVYTAFEQFIGTPAYMSPEQAEMSGLDIDTRSDIYSLGVLLYELLTGKTPFDAKELLAAGLDEMRRTIREVEPVKPSTRLTQEQLANRVPNPAKPGIRKLQSTIDNDLDWIVMKCLEKDRTRRYETANGLATDINHHLNDEPVLARPPSRLYRFQKIVRRNQAIFAAGAAVLLALLAGALTSTWQALQARKERDAATAARLHSDAINRFLTEDLLYQATPEQNAREKKVTVEEVLERAARKLDRDQEFAAEPLLEATLRYDIGSTYEKLGMLREAERHLRRSMLLRQATLGSDNRDTLAVKLQLASILLHGLRRFEEGEQLSHEALDQLGRLIINHRNAPESKLYRDGLDAMSLYAQALMYEGNLDKALELTRQNAADYERMFGADDLDSINELQNVALVLGARGDYAMAERNIREALRRYTRKGKTDDANAINGVSNLAICRQYQGDLQEAERLLREAHPRAVRLLGPQHPLSLQLQFRLARVLAEEGRLPEAEQLARESLAVRQQVLPSNSGPTAVSMLLLGRILVERGQPEAVGEAETLLQNARTIFIEHLAAKRELAAAAENWLGAIRLAQRDYPGAESFLLQNAERLFVASGELSPIERRLAVGHLVALYKAWDKPLETAKWQRKLGELTNPPSGAPN